MSVVHQVGKEGTRSQERVQGQDRCLVKRSRAYMQIRRGRRNETTRCKSERNEIKEVVI